MTHNLEALRQLMKDQGLSVYLVPSTDPHQSEYVPDCWQRRKWVSGFTGSVGDLVVTLDEAHLWTDSRYFLQAEDELDGSGITLQRMGEKGVPTLLKWLSTLSEEDVVGGDPRVFSMNALEQIKGALKKAGAKLKLTPKNLVDQVWTDRPPRPSGLVKTHPVKFCGVTAKKKLHALRKAMGDVGAQAIVVTRLDCVAWLLNIRGADVAFTPLTVAYAVVTMDDGWLFVDQDKLSSGARKSLSRIVTLAPYEQVRVTARSLAKKKLKVWVDPDATNAWIAQAFSGAAIYKAPCPVFEAKAQKNTTEIEGARAAHLRDGVAMVRFLHWLGGAVATTRVSELSAAAKLEELRSEGEHFVGLSFNTISAYGSHGAIVHYGATAETDRRLRPKGLYLIDSGGQYRDGTTDITRTVLLGEGATKAQKDQFTRVLKGHIGLAQIKFPAGVSGQRLDTVARVALWQAGLNYGHGTGHGVGSFLAVHEGPPSITPPRKPTVPLVPGHILSNEPGFYRAGFYGIRTENLVLVQEEPKLSRETPFFGFETLTLCPIDTRLIDQSLLTDEERGWLNSYHALVRRKLKGLLAKDVAAWLVAATEPI